MSLITIKTYSKTEQELKSEITEAIKEEIKAIREADPKKCKKNSRAISLLEQITPEQLEIIRPKVTEIKNLQFKLARFYRQKFRDGTLGREMMQNPKTLTTKDLGISFIYLINDIENPKQFDYVCSVLPSSFYVNYNNEISSYYLKEDIKSAYDAIYREVNAASLYNYPEVTSRIELCDWVILEEADMSGIAKFNVVWNLNSKDGQPLKMRLADYNLCGDISIDCEALLTKSAYSVHGISRGYNEKVYSGGIFDDIIDFIKGIFGK